MSPIKRLLLGLALMLGVLFAVAFALPQHISLARSTVIEAPESDVFVYLNNHRKFLEWSPWARRDPEAEYDLSGPEEGEGARMEWRSDHRRVGSGSSEIVASESNRYVEVALAMEDVGAATFYYRLTPAGAGTRITWGFDSDIGVNPLMRWLGLYHARVMGADFEAGLARLKRIVEAGG